MSTTTSIAHHQITAKLGEGGMGEVWRATDTKLRPLAREVGQSAGSRECRGFPAEKRITLGIP